MSLAFDEYCKLERSGRAKDLEALCVALRTRSKAALLNREPRDVAGLQTARACVDAEYEIRKVFMELVAVDVRVPLKTRVEAPGEKMSRWFPTKSNRSDVTRATQYRDAWLMGGQPLVDIFTLNNDLVVETVAKQLSLPIADGFTSSGSLDYPDWHCFTRAVSGIRLYKLHGSVNWRLKAQRISRQQTSGLRALLARGNAASEAWNVPLVWPGIYEELPQLDDLRCKFLTEAVSSARCVVIAGYRMKDPVIRDSLTTGLKNWPVPTGRRVIVVCGADYSDPSDPARKSILEEWISQWPGGIIVETRSGFAPTGKMTSGYFPDIAGNRRFCEIVRDAIASVD